MNSRQLFVISLTSIFSIHATTISCAQTLSANAPGQDGRHTVALHFRLGRSLLEKGYMDNDSAFDTLRKILTDSAVLSRLDSITVRASASPDGSTIRNLQLAKARAAAVKTYLMWQYPHLDRGKIHLYPVGEDWQGLCRLIEADSNAPNQEEILQTLRAETSAAEKNMLLRRIGNGAAFTYMNRHIFGQLRTGAVCMIFFRQPEPQPISAHTTVAEEPRAVPVAPQMQDSLPAANTALSPTAAAERFKRPLALKTNLLYDLVSIVNAEVEVPLSRRFSAVGEVIFPWWLWERKQHCFEVLSGSIEGRYWFRPVYKRQHSSLGGHNPLTGWFTGVYGSIGLYDLEWNRSGYQGEFFSAGAILGYSHPLSRAFNLEFSLGVGYMKSEYRNYQARQDVVGDYHLIRQYSGSWSWIGPTKAKISLVWYPHFKSGKTKERTR